MRSRDRASSAGRDTSKRPLVLAAVNYRKPSHHLGELYATVTKLLLAGGYGGKWQLKDAAVWPFDLCFGESISRGIPYKSLASGDLSRLHPPVVNFYQHFKSLTWKLEMVHCLRRYVPAAAACVFSC
jgi:hypothetical protein